MIRPLLPGRIICNTKKGSDRLSGELGAGVGRGFHGPSAGRKPHALNVPGTSWKLPQGRCEHLAPRGEDNPKCSPSPTPVPLRLYAKCSRARRRQGRGGRGRCKSGRCFYSCQSLVLPPTVSHPGTRPMATESDCLVGSSSSHPSNALGELGQRHPAVYRGAVPLEVTFPSTSSGRTKPLRVPGGPSVSVVPVAALPGGREESLTCPAGQVCAPGPEGL